MDFKGFSREELNDFSKEAVVTLYLQMAASMEMLSKQNEQLLEQDAKIVQQNEQLSKQIETLTEQLRTLAKARFERKTEKTSAILPGQIFMDSHGNLLYLNDIEAAADAELEEKTDEELLQEAKERAERRKRKKGQRQVDFSLADVVVDEYTMTEEQLAELFPEGYKELGVKISHRVEYEKPKVTVHEEHIHQYKSEEKNVFVTADHPKHLLDHSIMTPSLTAKIIHDKYINALPINRISRELGWLDVVVRPPTMSRQVIRISEKYLRPLDIRMRVKIKEAELMHCDETPFVCTEDRKKKESPNSKSWMWVYHTADQFGDVPPIFIYDYRDNRRTENVEEFLAGYKGIIMADGYEPYHAVARESNGDIVVAGCWAHAKRKFTKIVKADPEKSKGTVALEGHAQIAAIYHLDNMTKGKSPEERLKHRQDNVKPLVEDLFKWAEERNGLIAHEDTSEAVSYLVNQKAYLVRFLEDGRIPLDNNDAERSIRSFCVGRHSWHCITTSRGAATSAMLYSLAETAKANQLKPQEYFEYVLEQMLEHEDNVTDELIDSLLPWSESLPEKVRKKTPGKDK